MKGTPVKWKTPPIAAVAIKTILNEPPGRYLRFKTVERSKSWNYAREFTQ